MTSERMHHDKKSFLMAYCKHVTCLLVLMFTCIYVYVFTIYGVLFLPWSGCQGAGAARSGARTRAPLQLRNGATLVAWVSGCSQ